MAQGKPFPPEFRAEAVKLYRMGGRTLAETAREIGVSDWTSPASCARRTPARAGRMAHLRGAGGTQEPAPGEQNPQGRERDPPKGSAFFARETDQAMKFSLIDEEQTHHSVARTSSVLGSSRAGYYASRNRGPQRRKSEDEELKNLIAEIYRSSFSTYGVFRVQR